MCTWVRVQGHRPLGTCAAEDNSLTSGQCGSRAEIFSSARMKCPLERKRFNGREWLFKRLLHCLEGNVRGVAIVGESGCGKTAVCCELVWPSRADTVQRILNERLLAYHFCNAFEASSSSAGQFVLSLASQLLNAKQHPVMDEYRQIVTTDERKAVWLQDVAACEASPLQAFGALIAEPLAKLKNLREPADSSLFLLIDSMHDQCDRSATGTTASETVTILDCIAEFQEILPKWLLIVCTSRRQCKCLARKLSGFRRITLDDVERPQIASDIQRYILHRLQQMPVDFSGQMDDLVKLLTIKSDGCFLYLEMVLDAAADRFLLLRDVCQVPGTLNGLYLWMCDRLFDNEQPYTTVRTIFSVLLASRQPISLRQLYQCVCTADTSLSWAQFLVAVKRVARLLWTDESMCLLFHSSFADWLTDVKHATPKYHCQPLIGHGCLAMYYSYRAARLGAGELVNFAYHLSRLASSGLSFEQLALWMLQCGAKVDRLVLASRISDSQTERLLEQAGATLTVAGQGEGTDSPMFLAAKYGRTRVCEALLDAGAAVDQPNRDGWTPLRVAALGGHVNTVSLLLRRGAVVDARPADGRTALRAAAWAGHEQCCRLLLKAGADPNLADSDGRTPLITAAYNGHFKAVEALASAGADLNHRDRDGRNALSVLMINAQFSAPHLAVVQLLLSLGSEVDSQDRRGRGALHYAAREGLLKAADLLLDHGADTDREDDNGLTPLMLAASFGRRDLLRRLIDAGAALDSIDSTGKTALSLAAAHGDPGTVQLLVEVGLDEWHKDHSGWMPIHYAASEGHAAACSLLCEHNLDTVNATDKEGRHPLLLAVEEGHADVVDVLLQCGAVVTAPALDGRTALHAASGRGSADLCRVLLQAGALVDAVDVDGRTSLYYAALAGQVGCISTLLQYNADVDVVDTQGRSPLHVAAWVGDEYTVQLLLESGALVDRRDRDGRTALMVSAWRSHTNVAERLLESGADPNARCAEGATALSVAAQQGTDSLVALLLRHNVDMELKDSYGRSAADVARLQGHEKIAGWLEEASADNIRLGTTLSGSSKKSAESKSSSGYQSLARTVATVPVHYDSSNNDDDDDDDDDNNNNNNNNNNDNNNDNDNNSNSCSAPHLFDMGSFSAFSLFDEQNSTDDGEEQQLEQAQQRLIHVALEPKLAVGQRLSNAAAIVDVNTMEMTRSSISTTESDELTTVDWHGCRQTAQRASKRNLIITNPLYRRRSP
ncbi:Ankyrin repeat domain-containing protein 50 [Trichinella pseudospiralis]|uniref:Ankyrin repeat domain-containing protein 50 n=1 Tax=Trichinella pseudospiralis TaxID=6337 RepID=A0A0V1EV75_TRIPS|nr:Ankyrin repeat domain-containing protein 50 [Trichinella pseudospiralis]